jgi:hypothetical protein
MIVECASCKRNVVPKSDGNCPSCGASTAGAPTVPVVLDEAEAARLGAQNQHAEERHARRMAAEELRKRGNNLTLGGVALAVVAGGVSLMGYAQAADGGSYTLWWGGVVAGISMLIRGRKAVADAEQLERG